MPHHRFIAAGLLLNALATASSDQLGSKKSSHVFYLNLSTSCRDWRVGGLKLSRHAFGQHYLNMHHITLIC